MKNANVNVGSLKLLAERFILSLTKLKKYSSVLFFLLFAIIYAYMIIKINTFSNVPVDQDEVTIQINSSPALRIDEEAVRQLESLKDNSVNVQSLFEQGRTNPFQE